MEQGRTKELIEREKEREKLIKDVLSLDEDAQERILSELEKEDKKLAQEIRKRIEEEKKESFDELVRKPMDIGLVITLALGIPLYVVVNGAIIFIFLKMDFFKEFPMMLFILVFDVVSFAVLLSAGLYIYFKYIRKIPKKLDRIARKLQK